MTISTTVPYVLLPPKALERLLTYIQPGEDGCWRWSRCTDKHGYGRTNLAGRSYGAHRAVFELTVGPIPEGHDLHHLCEVKNCVNPTHLHPVTRADHNRLRAASRTHCFHDHAYDDANTRHHEGRRICRKCDARRQREYQARKKTA